VFFIFKKFNVFLLELKINYYYQTSVVYFSSRIKKKKHISTS
jgi:hypothetical protein